MTDPLTMSTCCPPDSGELVPAVRCAGRWFCEIQSNTPLAHTVSDFIRRRFLHSYGATLLAAVGVRNAEQERLFLEDYLSVPVQTLMPEPGTRRSGIAEIAHLAGVEAGVSRYLFASLSVWLDAAGYDWVVCTGTDQLRNSFHRLGIATQVLADADPSKLPDGGAGWGRYYDHHPVVMTIKVADGMAALRTAGLLKLVQPVVAAEYKPQADLGGAYGRLA